MTAAFGHHISQADLDAHEARLDREDELARQYFTAHLEHGIFVIEGGEDSGFRDIDDARADLLDWAEDTEARGEDVSVLWVVRGFRNPAPLETVAAVRALLVVREELSE